MTFYKWKAKYEGMEISEMRRMRLLKEENSRLKRILAQQALDLLQSCVCGNPRVTDEEKAVAEARIRENE